MHLAPRPSHPSAQSRCLQVDARRVTAILYLNPEWHPAHGGQLKLYPLPGPPAVIEPLLDRMVLFSSCQMLHRQALVELSCTGCPLLAAATLLTAACGVSLSTLPMSRPSLAACCTVRAYTPWCCWAPSCFMLLHAAGMRPLAVRSLVPATLPACPHHTEALCPYVFALQGAASRNRALLPHSLAVSGKEAGHPSSAPPEQAAAHPGKWAVLPCARHEC